MVNKFRRQWTECIRVNISIDKDFLKKMDKRAQELCVDRSEYIRWLVLNDLSMKKMEEAESK